jgi:hypothetical protein
MNTRPTPETNELVKTQLARVGMTPSVLAAKLTIKCESLERERDEWKAKYIQQNKDLGCEQMDPNGTIWDYAKTLQRERDEAREETIRTREFMDYGFAKAQEELATVTAQRDRLAVAASRLADVAEENTDDGDLWQTVIANVRALQSLATNAKL